MGSSTIGRLGQKIAAGSGRPRRLARAIPLRHQAAQVKLGRYCRAAGWLGELHLLYPFAGSRPLRDLLRQAGPAVGRLHVVTLMECMVLKMFY